MASMKEKALALARRGFAVFPLQENSKRPLPGSAGFKDATTDEFQIEEWWEDNPNANIGLYPDECRPRYLIVDVDHKKGGTDTAAKLPFLPPTMTVGTPSGGVHLYYALDSTAPSVQSSVERIGKGVDIRARGGYVVAPGSILNGITYSLAHQSFKSAAAPADLIAACGAAEERHSDADKWLVEPDLPVNVAHVIPWLKETEPAIEGQGGHDHTYQTAAMLRDRGVSAEKALALMEEHWNQKCSPPWPYWELEIVVNNAYQYAKRPAGTEAWSRKASALMAAQSTPAPEIPETAEPAPTGYSRLRPVTLDELARRPPPKWLVKGILPELGLGGIVGPVSAYKSFLALDAALHIAHGLQWMGLKTIKRPVVYITGEGASGIRARAQAWLIQHEINENPINFHLVEVMPPFTDPDAIRATAAYLKPLAPGMVIVDTVARAMAGLDENSVQGVQTFVQVADQLWQELRTFMLLVHHMGKDEKKGSRGSTALPAALDAQLNVSARPEDREAYLKLSKVKDAEAWTKNHVFKGFRVDLGTDEDGDSLSSLAFVHQGVAKPGTTDDPDNRAEFIMQTERWDALVAILSGKGPNDAMPTVELARLIAQHTTEDEGWPAEGPAQKRLIDSVRNWLGRTVAQSQEGQRWLINPGERPGGLLWCEPREFSRVRSQNGENSDN